MDIDNVQGHPAMDYRAHRDTYRGFITATIWVCIVLAIIMACLMLFVF